MTTKIKKGLGKGLEALLSVNSNLESVQTTPAMGQRTEGRRQQSVMAENF